MVSLNIYKRELAMSLMMDMTRNQREPREESPLMLVAGAGRGHAAARRSTNAAEGWPAEVDFIMSALEAGRQCSTDRRAAWPDALS